MITFKNPTVDYNGHTYQVELATIKSTWIGTEDHGIFTVSLDLEYSGGSFQGLGHLSAGQDGEYLGKVVKAILDTIGGYANWESLKGVKVYALREEGWNGMIRGLLSLDQQRVVIFKELFPND